MAEVGLAFTLGNVIAIIAPIPMGNLVDRGE